MRYVGVMAANGLTDLFLIVSSSRIRVFDAITRSQLAVVVVITRIAVISCRSSRDADCRDPARAALIRENGGEENTGGLAAFSRAYR